MIQDDKQPASHAGVETAENIEFSLVRGGPLRRMGPLLATPARGPLRAIRRAGILTAVCWVPLFLAAFLEGRALLGQWQDPLARHFSIHVQMLIVLPLLIIAEAMAEKVFRRVVRNFSVTGLVDSTNEDAFRAALRRAERLRDSKWGVIFVLALVLVRLAVSFALLNHAAMMTWAHGSPDRPLIGAPVAAVWYLVVCRSVLAALFGAWLWRLVVGWALFRWISKVDLKLVPTHPDRLGGLGFLQGSTKAAVLVVLAAGAFVAAPLSHEVVFGGASVKGLPLPIAIFVAIVLVVAAGPLFQFSGKLKSLKRKSLLQYGGLVARQGKLVHRKWIEGQEVERRHCSMHPNLAPSPTPTRCTRQWPG